MRKWNYFDEEKESLIRGVDSELMARLDMARHRAEIPFIVTSGYRNDEDNMKAGGVFDSAHTKGLAIDLRCTNSRECFRIIESLLHEGFKRIVIGLRFEGSNLVFHNIHVDTSNSLPSPVLAIKLYGQNNQEI